MIHMMRLLLILFSFFSFTFGTGSQYVFPIVDGTITPGEYGNTSFFQTSAGPVIYFVENASTLAIGLQAVDTSTVAAPYDGDQCLLYLDVEYVDNNNKQPNSNSSGALRSREVCGFSWDFSTTSFRPEIEIYSSNNAFQQSFFSNSTWSPPSVLALKITNIDAHVREYMFPWTSYTPRPVWDRFAFVHFCCNVSMSYLEAPLQPLAAQTGTVRNVTDFHYVTSLAAPSVFSTTLSLVYPPTAAPTTSSPVTSSPSTVSPTSLSPTSSSPSTRSPSSLSPTSFPYFPPTSFPSSSPTHAPTICCLQIITNNGVEGNITVITPENITITINTHVLPTNTTGYINITTNIVIPPSSTDTRVVSDVVRVDILLNNQTHNVTHVENAITFSLPYKQQFVTTCGGGVASPVCGFYIPQTSSWGTDGCSTIAVSTTTAQCVCNHLTDFAVLLQLEANEKNGCSSSSLSSVAAPVFYTFLAPYFLLFGFCSWCFFTLLFTCLPFSSLHSQHGVVALTALARFVACLFESGAIVSNDVGLAIVVSLPYLFEYWVFSLLAFQWGVLAYSKTFVTSKWLRIWLLVVNICGGGFTLFVFIAFAFSDLSSKRDFALAGQAVLTVLNLSLSLTFLINSRRLVRLLSRAPGSGPTASTTATSQTRPSSTLEEDTSDRPRPKGRIESRIQTLGIVAPVCFVLQSLMSFLALAIPATASLIVFTILFFLCDLIALSVLLLAYRSAYVRQIQRAKDRGKSSQKL